MTRRRTGWEMVLDMMGKALAELHESDFRHDEHVNKARKILVDALYLAKLTSLHELATK